MNNYIIEVDPLIEETAYNLMMFVNHTNVNSFTYLFNAIFLYELRNFKSLPITTNYKKCDADYYSSPYHNKSLDYFKNIYNQNLLNTTFRDSNTLLHILAQTKKIDIFELIYSHSKNKDLLKKQMNTLNDNENTPISIMIMLKNKILLDFCKKYNLIDNTCLKNKIDYLKKSIYFTKNIDFCKIFLSDDTNIKTVLSVDQYKNTSFHYLLFDYVDVSNISKRDYINNFKEYQEDVHLIFDYMLELIINIKFTNSKHLFKLRNKYNKSFVNLLIEKGDLYIIEKLNSYQKNILNTQYGNNLIYNMCIKRIELFETNEVLKGFIFNKKSHTHLEILGLFPDILYEQQIFDIPFNEQVFTKILYFYYNGYLLHQDKKQAIQMTKNNLEVIKRVECYSDNKPINKSLLYCIKNQMYDKAIFILNYVDTYRIEDNVHQIQKKLKLKHFEIGMILETEYIYLIKEIPYNLLKDFMKHTLNTSNNRFLEFEFNGLFVYFAYYNMIDELKVLLLYRCSIDENKLNLFRERNNILLLDHLVPEIRKIIIENYYLSYNVVSEISNEYISKDLIYFKNTIELLFFDNYLTKNTSILGEYDLNTHRLNKRIIKELILLDNDLDMLVTSLFEFYRNHTNINKLFIQTIKLLWINEPNNYKFDLIILLNLLTSKDFIITISICEKIMYLIDMKEINITFINNLFRIQLKNKDIVDIDIDDLLIHMIIKNRYDILIKLIINENDNNLQILRKEKEINKESIKRIFNNNLELFDLITKYVTNNIEFKNKYKIYINECLICYDIFYEGITTKCKHFFCKLCFDKWKKIQITCPMCRSEI